MKTPRLSLAGLALASAFSLQPSAFVQAATTIDAVSRYAYGANIGWMDWRGDTNHGAVIGEYVCSGYLWAANVGWIHLGSNAPLNGIRYQNNSATDYGVNHDGQGNLSGFAYGANIGWINFTNRDATGAGFQGPKVDLLTGRLSGFLWGADIGWISLSNAFAFVQTDSIRMGADSDGDGIADAWELQYTNTLTAFTAVSDTDHDGFTDLQEYLAETDPLDPNSNLRITSYGSTGGGTSDTITWNSRPTRLYHIQKASNLNQMISWTDVGLGLISPSSGPTTTRSFADPASPQRFFRIQALKPLSP